MGKIVKTLLVASVSFIFANHTLAAPADKPTLVEQHLMSKGVKIIQSFPSVSGFKAIVADNGKEKRLFYVTPDGKSLVAGIVFDTAGNNVTATDMTRAGVSDNGNANIKNIPAPQLESIWSRAEKLHWIADGKAGAKTIYVFFDPNCPYCHRLWTTLRNPVQSGKIQVRWLPVPILKESSKGLGAALYASSNPADAMARMINHQLEPIQVDVMANRNMAYNLLLLRDTGYTGVPTVLYRQAGKIHVSMGVPDEQELTAMLQ